MLKHLIDIFVEFGGRIFQQTIDIPMVTYYDPARFSIRLSLYSVSWKQVLANNSISLTDTKMINYRWII